MVTATNPEIEVKPTVAETVVAPVAAAPAVDVSAIPETPAELLKQWDVARKPLIHTVIAATLVRLWNAITGPGMTDLERRQRRTAEAKGYNSFVRLP